MNSPPTESGSSARMANDLVPEGGALHVSWGERSAPSHVKSTGMAPLDENERLPTAGRWIDPPGGPARTTAPLPPPQAAAAEESTRERLARVFIGQSGW